MKYSRKMGGEEGRAMKPNSREGGGGEQEEPWAVSTVVFSCRKVGCVHETEKKNPKYRKLG